MIHFTLDVNRRLVGDMFFIFYIVWKVIGDYSAPKRLKYTKQQHVWKEHLFSPATDVHHCTAPFTNQTKGLTICTLSMSEIFQVWMFLSRRPHPVSAFLMLMHLADTQELCLSEHHLKNSIQWNGITLLINKEAY